MPSEWIRERNINSKSCSLASGLPVEQTLLSHLAVPVTAALGCAPRHELAHSSPFLVTILLFKDSGR